MLKLCPDTAPKQTYDLAADKNNLLVHSYWLMSYISLEHDTWFFLQCALSYEKPVVALKRFSFRGVEPFCNPANNMEHVKTCSSLSWGMVLVEEEGVGGSSVEGRASKSARKWKREQRGKYKSTQREKRCQDYNFCVSVLQRRHAWAPPKLTF